MKDETRFALMRGLQGVTVEHDTGKRYQTVTLKRAGIRLAERTQTFKRGKVVQEMHTFYPSHEGCACHQGSHCDIAHEPTECDCGRCPKPD